MSDTSDAVRWLEEQAEKGEGNDDQPPCPMTGTTTCGSGVGCPTC